ncbi:hypothetical protein AMTRI_Chr07g78410 [Amborella trichopoda]
MGPQAKEIKYIENKNAYQVTFSKRRVGLCKKVFDLCVDGAAECAAVLAYSNNRQASSSSSQPTGRVHDTLMEEYYGLVEAEKALSFALNWRTPKLGSRFGSSSGFWWEADMARMGRQGLKHWAFETLRENLLRLAFDVQVGSSPKLTRPK